MSVCDRELEFACGFAEPKLLSTKSINFTSEDVSVKYCSRQSTDMLAKQPRVLEVLFPSPEVSLFIS